MITTQGLGGTCDEDNTILGVLPPSSAFFPSKSTRGIGPAKIKAMKRLALFVVLAQAIVVALFAYGLWSAKFPLGVPGEWEWQRINYAPEALSLMIAFGGLIGFASLVGLGYWSLSRSSSPKKEAAWLVALTLSAVIVQGVVQEGAPVGYGLSKWIIGLFNPASSGYYTVAHQQMADPARFLADYPTWIAQQDALHVGTHPPGLFVVAKGMSATMEANPGLSRAVLDFAPSSVIKAVKAFEDTDALPKSDAAGLALTGALTLLACSSTVVPLYLLARSILPAPAAWASASFWPLVPAALMFQPTADTAFPMLSTTALAMIGWACRVGQKSAWTLAFLSGLTMALGMFFTLAFLPVGLVVALVVATAGGPSWSRKTSLILATGLGFLLGTLAWWWATLANPFVIWWVNQKNHGRFYVEYPRSYGAWLVENPLELAVALGLPTTIWLIVGLGSPRQAPRVTWATLAVMVLLTITGKNLSEVARLWLPLMPTLLVAAGWGFSKVGGFARELAGSITLIGLQVLILEATIQVVYPI
jgi:hypothetical protein